MTGLIEQPRHYTRAEAQQHVHERATSLVPGRAAQIQMEELRTRIRGDDCRTVTHADLQVCIEGGVVVQDVGYCKGGALVTVSGTDCEGEELIAYVYLPDDEDMPLFLQDFVLKP